MRPSFNLVLIKKGNRSDIDLIEQDLDRPRLDHKKLYSRKSRNAQNLGQSHKILITQALDRAKFGSIAQDPIPKLHKNNRPK